MKNNETKAVETLESQCIVLVNSENKNKISDGFLFVEFYEF